MNVDDISLSRHRAPTLSVASYNIHKCVGTDGRFDPARILDVILDIGADVIALQEADARFGKRHGLLDLQALLSHGGYRAAPLGSADGLSHGWHGNVILYRDAVVHDVRRMKLPGLEPRGAAMVDLVYGRVPLRVIAVHLGLLRRSRAKQVEALLAAARPDDGRGVIVMGDMNEWRVGARSPLRMFAPDMQMEMAAVASFPSRLPLLALDRVLVSRNLEVLNIAAVNHGRAPIASDHLPIKALLGLNESVDRVPAGTGRPISHLHTATAG